MSVHNIQVIILREYFLPWEKYADQQNNFDIDIAISVPS